MPAPATKGRRLMLGGVASMLVAASVVCGLWWIRFQAKRAGLPEARMSELVRRDGRLYRTGQTAPFGGTMVDYYRDGSLRSRSRMSRGLLHGVSEGWYTNGQLEVQEHFRDGVSHGLRIRWYATGTNLSKAMIVEGKLQGTFQRWHENGVLAEQIEMRDGNPDGLSRAYYPSGCLKAEATLQFGKLVEQKSWKDGESPPLRAVAIGAN